MTAPTPPIGADWKIEELPALRNVVVEHVSANRLLLSRGSKLYETDWSLTARTPIVDFPAPAWRRAVGSTRLGGRLLRFCYYNAIPLGDERYCVTFDRSIAIVDRGVAYPVSGFARSFRVLRGGMACADDGKAYCGEYFDNSERSAIHIYSIDPARREATIVWTFAPGEIRHVHGVYRDPRDGSLWVTAGDIESECRILRTADHFKTLEVVGSGTEDWRAVSLAFRSDGIVYGTDAEFQTNRVFFVPPDGAAPQIVGEVDGTVFYALSLGDDVILGSTAELCPSNPAHTATVWLIDANRRLYALFTRPKDPWHRVYFQFGHYLFPSRGADAPNDVFFFTARGLRGVDARTYSVRRVAHGV